MKTKKISLKITALTLFFGALGAFIIHTTKDTLLGAPLSVRMVKNGTTVAEPFLPIQGNAKHALQVHINGRQIPVDQEGNFSDGVILSPGYNMVTITQEDRFGKEKEKIVHVIAEPAGEKAVTIHYQEE